MNPITIQLSEPIQAHGETVSEISLSTPRAKHLRAMPVKAQLDMGDLLNLAGECAGLPPSSMDQLAAGDAFKVVEAMGNFLAGGPGAMPSS